MGFLASDTELVAAFEALSSEQRQTLHVEASFPSSSSSPLARFAGMRLNAAQHSWDVRVGLDTGTAIAADTAVLLAEHFATDLSFLLGFIGKADALDHPSLVDIGGSGFALVIADTVSLATSAPPATFTGPLEAAIRLVAGRLTPERTPADVEVTGNITFRGDPPGIPRLLGSGRFSPISVVSPGVCDRAASRPQLALQSSRSLPSPAPTAPSARQRLSIVVRGGTPSYWPSSSVILPRRVTASANTRVRPVLTDPDIEMARSTHGRECLDTFIFFVRRERQDRDVLQEP